MGYRITYGRVKKVRGTEMRICRRAALTGICFLLFLILVQLFWPRGAEILRVLLPEEGVATALALEEAAMELKQGGDLPDAVSDFLRGLKDGR